MKVTVLGAGALGSLIGGLIKHHAPDIDLLLIARGDHGEQMRRQGGVALEGPWGVLETRVPVSSDIKDLAGSDFVLLTVKAPQTESALEAAQEHLGEAIVISIQNGVNQPVLQRYVPAGRLVTGMTAANAAIHRPGTVCVQRNGPIVIGPGFQPGAMDPVRAAERLLSTSGMKIALNPNILGAQYNKLVFNTLGSAASLSATSLLGDAILHRPWRNSIALPLHGECLKVFAAAGVRLESTPSGSDAHRFGRLLRTLNRPVLGSIAQFAVRRFFNAKPLVFSLQIDLLHGKPTEVDFINGEIVRLAAGCGLTAPWNARVVELVRELEDRGGGVFFGRDEVVSRFQDLES